MHRQVHRTDVVPELARRQSISLVQGLNKCLSTVCEYKSHVAEESGLRAVVGTVPEPDSNPDNQSKRRGRLNKHIHRKVKCAHLVPEPGSR